MPVTSPKELFIHELSDIYDAEQRIAHMLTTLVGESSSQPQVSAALQHHHEETLQQIRNLEQCFQELGAQLEKAPCEAIAGLKKEHDSFLKEEPSPEVLVMYNLGGASKTEHYEIASYRGLIEMATLMGQQKVADLLKQNLRQEEAMAKKVEQITLQLGQQLIKPGA